MTITAGEARRKAETEGVAYWVNKLTREIADASECGKYRVRFPSDLVTQKDVLFTLNPYRLNITGRKVASALSDIGYDISGYWPAVSWEPPQ